MIKTKAKKQSRRKDGVVEQRDVFTCCIQIYRPWGVICLIAGYYDFRKIIARQSVGNVLIMRNYFHTFCRGGRPAGIKYS